MQANNAILTWREIQKFVHLCMKCIHWTSTAGTWHKRSNPIYKKYQPQALTAAYQLHPVVMAVQRTPINSDVIKSSKFVEEFPQTKVVGSSVNHLEVLNDVECTNLVSRKQCLN